MPHPLTPFFDGDCPLCSREIAHYRRTEPGGRIRWIDITREADEIRHHGLEPREVMASFHVMDGDGTLRTAAAAFIRLWRELPRYHWLPRFREVLHLVPPMEWAYGRFARWLFAKRYRKGACSA